jgi:hypothetical protein
MSVIKFRAEAIKAIIPFCSTEETRYYLCGALIEPGKIIATDGHRLVAIKPSDYVLEGSTFEPFILPSAILKKIAAIKPDHKWIHMTVVFETEAKIVSVIQETEDDTINLASFPYSVIDGTFPDWRRVVPAQKNYQRPAVLKEGDGGEWNTTAFNLKYIADFKSLSTDKRAFGQMFMNLDPDAPSVMRVGCEAFEAFAVIMGAKQKFESTHPEWLLATPGASETVTK